MEKLVLAINAVSLNMHDLDFACYIANLTGSPLTGIFLEDIPEEPVPVMKKVFGMPYVETIVAGDIPENKTIMARCEENTLLFQKYCTSKGVTCDIQILTGAPAAELVRESRYCDLMIVNAGISSPKYAATMGTKFVQQLLEHAECPVIIAPESFEKINEIIFTFDGSSSAVFATKQFTHLFPQLSTVKTVILHVDDRRQVTDEEHDFEKWLALHYSSVESVHLQGRSKDELFEYLLMKQNIMVVMGAYGGRNLISHFIRHSHAELLLKTVTLPIFIAHY